MHQGFSIDIPVNAKAPNGDPDATTPITVSSTNTNVRCGVRPDNPRMAFVDGINQTSGANVVVTVTEGGQQFIDQVLVVVTAPPPPPNLGGVSFGGAASAEYPTPSSR